ncbi:RHS repeat protein [Kiritimatiella glycovorans]|uniref:Cell wall-associated polypeptide CWBP200 n=1 Tax=Kiritimatiella glycovorans TaxID=1307763 RepID=A0A0G3EGK7_9BACT|nr:RHS repeat protein [Kiritimatiella glycovorans]AKJ63925.1 hypothetical protein L21SP4_00656 [Kiritimatiella glycovorans]
MQFPKRPVDRVIAVNGHDRPTIDHWCDTYLWGREEWGSDSGDATGVVPDWLLREVCQWRFVTDEQGRVMHEIGENAEGKVVWILQYNALNLDEGQPRSRFAHFVGAGGYAQRQRQAIQAAGTTTNAVTAAAEYVRISYGAGGMETLVEYCGAHGEPLPGLEGAHASAFRYNEEGRLVEHRYLRLKREDRDARRRTLESYEPLRSHAGAAGHLYFYSGGRHVRSISYGAEGTNDLCCVRSGWCEARYRHDKWGNIVSVTLFDDQGRPAVDDRWNFHSWSNEYNPCGDTIQSRHYGPEGDPCLHSSTETHGTRYAFDDQGRIISEVYLGLDGEPESRDGVTEKRYTWIDAVNVGRERYFDRHGHPCLHENGFHGRNFSFDRNGYLDEQVWVDLNDHPVCPEGQAYAINRLVNDDRGNCLDWRCFGADGRPVLDHDGTHRISYRRDSMGNILETRYFGCSNQPVAHRDGNHAVVCRYDARGNEIEKTWLNIENHPTAISGCEYATVRRIYDGFDRLIEERYYDERGQPMLCEEGCHGYRLSWNERGHPVERVHFGCDRLPCANARGIAILRFRYDERGRRKVERYFDASGTPLRMPGGYCGLRFEHDDRDRQIAETFLGPDGEPTFSTNGYVTLRWTLDDEGRRTSESFYDEDGRPALHPKGYHRCQIIYEGTGDTYRYFDALGDPTRHSTYDYGFRQVLNEQGKLVEFCVIDAHGRPASHTEEGFTFLHIKYDESGREIERRYHDAGNAPTTHRDGNHGYRSKLDEAGRELERLFFDTRGRPVNTTGGYAVVRKKYDETGNATMVSYFDQHEQPVADDKGIHRYECTFEGDLLIEQRHFGPDGEPCCRTDGHYSIARRELDENGNPGLWKLFDEHGHPLESAK